MLSRQKYTEIVGNNIRKIRSGKGITQDELATKCGFYRTYINLVETARRSPSGYSIYRIAKALDVPVDDIFPTTV